MSSMFLIYVVPALMLFALFVGMKGRARGARTDGQAGGTRGASMGEPAGAATHDIVFPHPEAGVETGVPGVFVAGELGGMGLLGNAVEQARRAVEAVSRTIPAAHGCEFDLLVAGAGPAGIAASLAAKQLGLRCVTIEQDSAAGSVAHYPRKRISMAGPADLPLAGTLYLRDDAKEALRDFLRDAVARERLDVRYGERLEDLERLPDGFVVSAGHARYRTRCVLLCVGRRGTPRQLEVPGEDLPKVVYRLVEPEQYRGQHVLVVGGGDSALEAALRLAGEPGTRIWLSYRGASFTRVQSGNRERLEQAVAAQRIGLLLESRVAEIRAREVVMKQGSRYFELANDAVIVCAGGLPPEAILARLGIATDISLRAPGAGFM